MKRISLWQKPYSAHYRIPGEYFWTCYRCIMCAILIPPCLCPTYFIELGRYESEHVRVVLAQPIYSQSVICRCYLWSKVPARNGVVEETGYIAIIYLWRCIKMLIIATFTTDIIFERLIQGKSLGSVAIYYEQRLHVSRDFTSFAWGIDGAGIILTLLWKSWNIFQPNGSGPFWVGFYLFYQSCQLKRRIWY